MKKIAAPFLFFLAIACSTDATNIIPETTNNAPVINSTAFTIEEHSQEGMPIGFVEVMDVDGDELTFSIESDFDLEINQETGEVTIGANLKLDFETEQAISFIVSVFDGKVITDKTLVLTIQDVDEMTLLSAEQLELVDYFKFLTLWKGPSNTPVDFNRKWGSTMKMYLDGTISNNFSTTVQSVITQYNSLTEMGDFNISLVDELTEANAHVFFGEKSEVEAIWPDMFELIKDGSFDGYAMTPSENAILVSTRIWVSNEFAVLFKHELGHALGFGHSDRCDDEKSFLCSTIEIDNDILPIEQDIIKYSYHSEMEAGLSETEMEPVLANIIINEGD